MLRTASTEGNMADVRALLAAERESRRIKHPHLTYSKTGALTCTICNLNIKSEQLWPGHQKSAAHRKNVQRTTEQPIRPAKRKIEHVDVDEEDTGKKQRPFTEPSAISHNSGDINANTATSAGQLGEHAAENIAEPAKGEFHEPLPVLTESIPENPPVTEAIDEDEWAAFEKEVAPLAQHDYSTATIEAAPVSAAEIEAQQKVNSVQQREDEAQAEKEEESRRMEEEFEVMEEMEDRVKRLRARHETLRKHIDNTQTTESVVPSKTAIVAESEDTESEGDVDDWYG